jgi:subtilisin-like proprotein convertase family protein
LKEHEFNGMQLRGRWYLDLLDTNPGDAGVLHCWQLTIRYKPAKRRKG